MTRSTFQIPCLCGATVETRDRETKCPHCGRILVVEWGEAAEEDGKP